MKIQLIDDCGDCKHFFDGHGEEFCEHHDAYRDINRMSSKIPEWCPLEDAPQPDGEGDEEAITEAEWIKQAEEYEKRAQSEYAKGEVFLAQKYEEQAKACRKNAFDKTINKPCSAQNCEAVIGGAVCDICEHL